MVVLVIAILIVAIVVLVTYNLHIQKKIEAYNNINDRINNLSVLQDFMNVAGQEESVDEKLKKINEIVIEKYNIKYSTIVVFNGAEYVVKASNVDEKHYEVLSNLHTEEIFQDSVSTATPKYITIDNENEKLPYQKTEMGRAKSAMFFPLYIENVYIGYWLIEGSRPHEFDDMDTTILEVVRNNIVSVLKTVSNQGIIENIVRDDRYSTLKTAEYLYGEGRKTIDQYTTSTVCLFRITNLEDINEYISRKTGDEIITRVCEMVKTNLSSEYIFVRYMGPKFAIVFSGIEIEAVETFLEEVKKQIEEIEIEPVDVEFEEEDVIATPKINIVITTYYKGTALEGLMKKMEEYLDKADKKESNINYL